MGIFEVFYSPGSLFASIPDKKGAWILPFLLNIILATMIYALMLHYIGQETILRQSFEGTRMSPEQIEMIVQQSLRAPAWRSYIGPIIGGALFPPFLAGLLYAFALMSNKQAKFVDELTMVCFAYFPYYVVTCLMSALILMASPDPGSLNVKNLIATNVAAFLDKNTVSKGVYSLASSIDLLSFVEIFLLAFGFAKVNRTKLGYGLLAVLGLWFLYVCVKMALSAIF